MESKKEFAVVTRVTPVRERGRIIVHSYGPFDRNEAGRVSTKFKRQAVREGWASRAEVSICKLLSFSEANPEEVKG